MEELGPTHYVLKKKKTKITKLKAKSLLAPLFVPLGPLRRSYSLYPFYSLHAAPLSFRANGPKVLLTLFVFFMHPHLSFGPTF